MAAGRRGRPGGGAGAWWTAAAVLALIWAPARAGADRGDLGAGARLQWAGGPRLGGAATASLGIADAWAAHLEVGGDARLEGAPAARAHLVAGVTWLWDVLRWVPAATLAPGVEVDAAGRWHAAALARVELRYFLAARVTVAAAAAARWGREGLAPEVGVALGWQS